MKPNLDSQDMKMIAQLLETLMPPRWGFTLLTFEMNNKAAMVNYISSADRETMKGTIEAMLDKWNRGEDFVSPNLN